MAMNVTSTKVHCVLSFSVSGSAERIAVTLGVNRPTAATADTVATGVYTALTSAGSPFVAANMLNSWTFNGVETFIGGTDSDLQGAHMVPIVGTSVSSGLPPNCAVLITKNTAFGGRRMRGRMYMPPVQAAETQVNQLGVIDSTTVAFIQSCWNSAHGKLVTADMQPHLFHAVEPGLIVPTPVTGFSVSPLLATQRRRMR